MKPQPFDPGLTQKYTGRLRRTINKDGTFNVNRSGGRLVDRHFYLWLISMPWPHFLGLVVLFFLTVNVLFACLYLLIGIEHLQGANDPTLPSPFWNAFFFSVHTSTTVGYGDIVPRGFAASMLSSFEALCGLMGFALATGLLYGRFSRPSARLVFSERALVAPYQERTSIQFRLANSRSNILMELEAKVLLMLVENDNGEAKRRYFPLQLERDGVYFLAITWTVVHPIDETSPLWGRTAEDLERGQAELLILIKGFDDTFSQTVHARHSYRYDEIEWGARFAPAFRIDSAGDLVLELEKIGSTTEPVIRSETQSS